MKNKFKLVDLICLGDILSCG